LNANGVALAHAMDKIGLPKNAKETKRLLMDLLETPVEEYVPTLEEMRWAIMKGYPGTDWLADCAVMTEKKVRAAYSRLTSLGYIKKVEKK
jgi:hypothetical protein